MNNLVRTLGIDVGRHWLREYQLRSAGDVSCCASDCMDKASAYVLSRQQPSPQRRIRYDSDTQFASSPQNIRLRALDVEREKRVFYLDGCDGIDGMGTTDCRCGTFRKANVFSLAESGRQRLRMKN